MGAIYGVVDKLDRQPRDVSAEKLAELGLPTAVIDSVLELPTATIEKVGDVLEGRPAEEHSRDFIRYLQHLEALDVSEYVVFDPSIVRGLAYYTGIVFELYDARGEFRAICGGGRYDNLLASLSGTDLPALGFGMGDVVLGELLRARGQMPAAQQGLEYWVAFQEPELFTDAMKVATQLRRSGASVEYSLRPMQLGKQLQTATKAGALAAVILRADGSAIRKDLATGAEEPFTFPNG
jgi:histidyl-tRNA synthetase